MEYSEIIVRRIQQLCKKKGCSINKLATMSGVKANAFNMTLAEFLDFDELNEYSFEDNNEE